MQAFTTLTAIAAPLPLVNVDTDKIIPARHLKTIKRSGLGVALFETLRYYDDGRERADFILNREPYREAQILIAGVFYDADQAPAVIHDFALALPLTHLVNGLSGAMIDGESVAENWVALLVLVLWAAFGAIFAVRGFSWEARRSR